MIKHWDGPSLRQQRPRKANASNPFTTERAPHLYRHRTQSLMPHRWRVMMRFLRFKLRDIEFLARYSAHFVVLIIAITATIINLPTFWLSLSASQSLSQNEVPAESLWEISNDDEVVYLTWNSSPLTIIPERPAAARLEPIVYNVREGDNPDVIAQRFGLQPDTVIWSNRAVKENPDLLSLGQTLILPPIDGIVHTIERGDTLEVIAQQYEVDSGVIVAYAANQLPDSPQPLVEGQQVVVPGGIVPTPTPTPTPTRTPTPTPTQTPMPTRTATPFPTATFVPTRVIIVAAAPTYVPTNIPTRIPTNIPTRIPTNIPTRVPTRAPLPTNTPIQSTNNFVGSTGCCRWPVVGRVTTQPSSWHMAIDILAPLGTPIRAGDGGTVTRANWDNTGYGYVMIINHGNGITTLYSHLSSFNASYGDYVNKGAIIGRVGATGRATAPHLHFEVRQNNYRQNPYSWLP